MAQANISVEDTFAEMSNVVNDFMDTCLHVDKTRAFRPLRLLASTYAQQDFPGMLADYQAKTGWQINVDYVDVTRVVPELLWSAKNAPLTYDGWLMLKNNTLDWPDVTEYVREISSTYAGSMMGVPTSNNPVLLYYRKDVFAKSEIDLPITWDDLLAIAERLNGTDFNGDGKGDHALCVQFNGDCYDVQFMPAAVLATMTQAAGPKTGFLFDPQTMQSFVGSAAMEASLEVIQGLVRYSAVKRTCALLNPSMMGGTCALTIAPDLLFKVVQKLSPFKGFIGVARPPGSTHVLNRQTGRMETCTRELCPYADLMRSYDDREVIVNHSPYWGIGGVSGYVNARHDPVYQEAMYQYFSFILEPTYSKQRVIQQLITGPFRTSHLDTSAASLADWKSAGFDPSAVKELMLTVKSVIVVLLLLLTVYFLVMRHSKRSILGRPGMPHAGDDTTLCVTDIMDSTALWETLDAGSMSRAIATHHTIVRKALAHFHCYEQATEGDSFLLAFHTPSEALGFAMQLQASMLSADWEPELLAHPSCAPVAMAMSDALLDAGGGDDRFHLCAAADLLLGSIENMKRANSGVGIHGSYGPAMHSSAPAPGPSFASRISSLVAFTRTPHKDHVTIVFNGLRVRVGMHSGASKTDVERNSTAGRHFFTGAPLALAKAVGDAGAGGMVLLTHNTFERLRPHRALSDVLVLCMGEHLFKDDSRDSVCLYQAIERPLVPRLAAFEPMRNLETLQLGGMDAPLGNVTIAFVNIVGMALSVFVALSTRLLHQAGGYVVELTSSGLCLAAFCEPASTVAWGLCLIEVMKHADWDEELLAHELCEEVLVHGSTRNERLLFRGPRLKVTQLTRPASCPGFARVRHAFVHLEGIDEGPVQADVSPVTGRMTYRGRVMNCAARICGKASSGMQWCSTTVWKRASERVLEQLPSLGIVSTELGAVTLKGISGNVKLVQCALGAGSAPMATVQVMSRTVSARATPLSAGPSTTADK
ncbi:hypothetical protein FOA52_000074 [Chlamydomonas sp. UWO 241]|nr:hypothetical protein FOA52_000074 [Chlamydomonas sp. UWO 241]